MIFGALVGFLLFAVALYVLWKIRSVLLLAFAAVVFATVINRLVQQLQRRLHLKRGIAVALAVSLVLGAIAGIVAFIVLTISGESQQFAELFPQVLDKLNEWYSQVQELVPLQLTQEVENLQALLRQLPTSASRGGSGFFGILRNSVALILQLLLVIAVIIMLLANPSAYRRAFVLLFPSFYRRRTDEILSQCEESLFGWFIGILFNITVITVLSGIGLWFLGIPLPLVNAILAGLLTFIPNLGPTLSVIPPAILAFSIAPWKALAVVILYIVIQQVESNVLTPLVMKQQVSLLPAVTLLTQIAFAAILGLLGLFLALPMIVVLQVWLKELLVKDIMNDWSSYKKVTVRRRGLKSEREASG